MDEKAITFNRSELPATIDDLSKFVLIGRDKLTAVRAEIAAIKKVGLASEVLEQKRAEAQEIAELVTLSEMRMGEMLSEIPKATPNNNPFHEIDSSVELVKPKSQVLAENGISQKNAERYQQMAAHPEIVEQAIAEARENDDIVSRASVLRKIQEAKKPHVSFNSGENEWYTPPEYIEAARAVMGSIDLDPATSDIANKTVQASHYYTVEMNGLEKPWFGCVWMNPPYSSDKIGAFIDKLVAERPNYDSAIVLVNNATETAWFTKMIGIASAVCFPHGRIKFIDTQGKSSGAPLQGQAVLYIGNNVDRFCDEFAEFGWLAVVR